MIRNSFCKTTGRRLRSSAAIILIATALAGCAAKAPLTTGSIGNSGKAVESMNAHELRAATERYGRAYEKNPADAATGMRYAEMLRMSGRNDQALAVMQQVAIHNPEERTVLAAYGKALAGAGQLQKALETIRRAQTPDRPNWQLLSAEGAVLDQLGNAGEARERYRKALDLKPNEPSILSNLGISYLLAGDLRTSETYMRKASTLPGADSRVRQNLALVVGLQGRFAEAEQIARAELAPDQAEANVAYLRAMLSQQNAWAQLSDQDGDAGNTN
ncbi:tetratricopeptide repeat protein [Pseudohoeflea coraliihabitans]|uniref:Tetratricopeptide repeat protein n=1 Tax=Pseudohoeflea coraliihabitans TaxID=2860393 RepID=A0ABS6WP98_9HYPH|nr:tetratricopeptide repeat protein [Pseudohoeflea sp. DP4N28-3]MBW3097778.1 tetratricopeptide repeat protein [Pseudohoeflea sp. DP4N28-3]